MRRERCIPKDRERLELDIECPPGDPRPGDLLPKVLYGTGVELDPGATDSRFFGWWTWTIPADMEKAYREARPVIHQRLKNLYESGVVRAANCWGSRIEHQTESAKLHEHNLG